MESLNFSVQRKKISLKKGRYFCRTWYKLLHTTFCAPASYRTVVFYETMGEKRFIQLTIKKCIDKKMKNSYQIARNVFTIEDKGG